VYLIEIAIKHSATSEELQELINLLKRDNTGEITRHIELLLKGYETTGLPVLGAFEIETMADAVLQVDKINKLKIKKGNTIYRWNKVAVAASVLFMIAMGSYYLFYNKPSKQNELTKILEKKFKNDANPGKYKAKLTLADGKIIVLDNWIIGEIAEQGGTEVLNKDGGLVYAARKKSSNEILYNTLSTARGETYATLLADGSKIWLNSASSIKFPVAFVGKERKVEITGEAYFEVAKDATKKFIVAANKTTTEVLGTHFNISSYAEETTTKVTLLEGKVKVGKLIPQGFQVLSAGQQAEVNADIKVLDNVNIEAVMAWKNGIFQFENADIHSIMRQVARWYDVDVVFEKEINTKFGGIIPMSVNLSKLLTMLELTNHVHFKINGRTIIVNP